MRLKYAMVLWNADHDLEGRDKNMPRIAVVDHRDHAQNRKYDFLYKSMGSCCAGFKTCDPCGQAAHMLALMNIIIFQHGVPAEEAHKAFLAIDEYVEWMKDTGADGNPFADLYWRYQELMISANAEAA